jgi:organic radical activating enzyme
MNILNKVIKGVKEMIGNDGNGNRIPLSITEKFCSIQGESDELGIPSIFIRTGGCTLSCPWCDTKYASNDGFKSKFQIFNDEEAIAFTDLVATAPKDEVPVQHAVVTGGEPLMIHNLSLITTIVKRLWNVYNIDTTFETTLCMMDGDVVNKNVVAMDSIVTMHDMLFSKEEIATGASFFHFAVSPKFNPNCYKVSVKVEDILRYYEVKNWLSQKVNEEYYSPEYFCDLITFKPVYHKDIESTLLTFANEQIPEIFRKRVCIMPFTPTTTEELNGVPFNEAYNKSCLDTVNFCKRNNLRYSPREHINLWGLRRGV